MAAWRYKLAQTEMSQRDLAVKTGSSYQWLNAAYKERTVRGNKKQKASSALQKAIAEVFGYGWIEFLQLGKRISLELNPEEEGQKNTPLPTPQTTIPTKPPRIDPDDVVDAVNALVKKFRQCDADLRMWRLIFDLLPIAAMVIQDGIIIFQNQRSRAWGHELGLPIADSCVNVDCEKSGDCPVHRSIETMLAASGTHRIGDTTYRVQTVPIQIGDSRHIIVLANEVNGVGFHRRRSDDRAE